MIVQELALWQMVSLAELGPAASPGIMTEVKRRTVTLMEEAKKTRVLGTCWICCIWIDRNISLLPKSYILRCCTCFNVCLYQQSSQLTSFCPFQQRFSRWHVIARCYCLWFMQVTLACCVVTALSFSLWLPQDKWSLSIHVDLQTRCVASLWHAEFCL